MNAALASGRPYRLTVDAYRRMGKHGIIPPEARVELIDGAIVEMAPIGPLHAGVVDQLGRALQRHCDDDVIVRVQNPIELPRYSEPQPDIALLQARDDFYKSAHPQPDDMLLAIEVSHSTLAFDRDVKLPLYARHGIAEAWLVDVVARRIIRHARPQDGRYEDEAAIDDLATVSAPGMVNRAIDLSTLFD